MSANLPWRRPELEGWQIVGMNHYRLNGGRFLFVAMVKDGFCIKAEGVDTMMLWDELAHKATLHFPLPLETGGGT